MLTAASLGTTHPFMAELAVSEPRSPLPAKRGRGRPPGTPNKVTRDVRELIMDKGRPVEFLCDVLRGRRTRIGPQAGPGQPAYAYPSFAERMRAAEILIDKIVPDRKELSGNPENPLVPARIASDPKHDNVRDIAMIMMHVLREAQEEGKTIHLAEMLTGRGACEPPPIGQAD